MRKINKLLAAALVAVGLISGAAHATDFAASGQAAISGSTSSFSGSGNGYTDVSTVGGSQATSGVNGTGYSAQSTYNTGGGYSAAGSNVSATGVSTYTNTSSNANSVSNGYTSNGGYGNTTGSFGTDVKAVGSGSYSTQATGVGYAVGGYVVGSVGYTQ